MTTKTFTINGHEVLAVQVPKGARHIRTYGEGRYLMACHQHGSESTILRGNWQLIVNKPCSEWSEAEAAMIVDSIFDKHYMDYQHPGNNDYAPGYTLDTALASLHSLLASKELNPAETVLLRKKV